MKRLSAIRQAGDAPVDRCDFVDPIVRLGVAELTHQFERGDVSPVQACAVYIERVRRHDGAIGAFTAIDADRARSDATASARRWARGAALSPIDGVPIGIKANIAVRGLPWTAGVGAWRTRIADEDAACIARLRAGGAVILGLLNMDEGALGATTDNPWYGRTHNPHRRGFSAGGSSGGAAAAVAAGLCAAALGTDTMGSVRIPASYCGVFGFVPRVETIDRRGIVPLAISFDRVGILARSLSDIRCMFRALDGDPAPGADDDGRTLAALAVDDTSAVDASVHAMYDRARRQMASHGVCVVDIDLPGYRAEQAAGHLLRVVEVEAATAYRDLLADRPNGMGPRFRRLLQWGAALPAAQLTQARRDLSTAGEAVLAALRGHACLLLPATPQPAFAFDGDTPKNQALFTSLASITGLPAIVLPLRCEADGLPHAIQLIASTDQALLRYADRIPMAGGRTAPPQAFLD